MLSIHQFLQQVLALTRSEDTPYIWELFWGFTRKVLTIAFMVNLTPLNLLCSSIRRMSLLSIHALWPCPAKLYGFGARSNCSFSLVECRWLNCSWRTLYPWSAVMVTGKSISSRVVRSGTPVDDGGTTGGVCYNFVTHFSAPFLLLRQVKPLELTPLSLVFDLLQIKQENSVMSCV